ncbi:MAG: substrate-binding domain-containing protein [Kiritimatiellae bacterium]|nr:substrate-binding domain-containing protein [Kiritimatiellia bacterium]
MGRKTDNGQRPLRILAHMDEALRVSREATRGILRYAATHPDVEVRLFGPGTAARSFLSFRDWRPDGLIAGLPPLRGKQRERFGKLAGEFLADAAGMGCRAAVLSASSAPPKCPLRVACVSPDNVAVARCAAEHFAAKGVRHFAYVGDYENGRKAGERSWSAERDAAFRACAERAGCTYSTFGEALAAPDAGARQRKSLAKWVAALPKPCGILAARDLLASNILLACRDAGVAVPQAALVLGVDDNEFVCPHTTPTLSSIAIDYEGGGYMEMEALVAMLRGGEAPAGDVKYGVKGVVHRLSTSDPNEEHIMAARAEEFIAANAASGGIGVGDVAKAVFASVRLLEMNFKAVTGRTVCQAIQDAKLRRVCSMLVETQTPIGDIAGMCGFESDGYLKELFRRRFGCTMRDWRHFGGRPKLR